MTSYTWEYGSAAVGLHFTITGTTINGSTTFTVNVLSGSLNVNALYWGDGDSAANESSLKQLVTSGDTSTADLANDATAAWTPTKSDSGLNMNGSNTVWGTDSSATEVYDGGIKLSNVGLGPNPLTYLTANPDDAYASSLTFTVNNLDISNFSVLGVRATSTSTAEGSIKWADEHPVSLVNDETGCVTEPDQLGAAGEDDNVETYNANIFDNDSHDASDTLQVTGWHNGGDHVAGDTVTIANSEGATVTLNGNGSYTVDASAADELGEGEHITETFTVDVQVNGSYTLTETLTVEICGLNDGPDAKDDDFTAPDQCIVEDASKSGNVLADNGNGADSDVDRTDAISVTGIRDGDGNLVLLAGGDDGDDTATVTLASGAKVTIHSDGSFTYDTNGAWAGLNDDDHVTDSFVYQLSDNHSASDEATATVCIDGVGGGGGGGGGGGSPEFYGLSQGFWSNPNGEQDWDLCKDASFETFFGVNSTWDNKAPYNNNDPALADLTLWEALTTGGGGQNQLANQAVAAVLNASDEDLHYKYTIDEIKAMVQDAFDGDDTDGYTIVSVAADLEYWNAHAGPNDEGHEYAKSVNQLIDNSLCS